MRLAAHLAFTALVLVASACADTPSPDAPPSGRVSSAVLNGRVSGDDESAAVYIETRSSPDDPQPLRCSGRIIAPGLAVTARHCLLKRRSANVRCNPDGSPVDITESVDVRVEPPESVSILVGAQKSAARKVAAKEIFTELEISLCRSDIAYIALAEAGLDTRTPLRKTPPRLGEMLSITGWGYTSDERVALPDTPSTIERPITETGPGLIPSDTFAIAGGSVCLGDSGASARAAGSLLGVYSRIDNPDACSLELNRNIFVAVTAHLSLANIAYAAIGETPWFEGEAKPWLAKAGASCTRDDECSSERCDASSSTCAAPCGAAGFACERGKTCTAEQCVDAPAKPPPPPAPEEEEGGCTMSRATTSPASALLIALSIACAMRRRRSRY